MNVRATLIVALSLVCGVSAVFFMKAFLKQGEAAPRPDTVPVVVASTDVGRFEGLSPDLLVVKEYPRDLAPAGCMKSVDDAVGHVTLVSIGKGEPIPSDKVSAKGVGRGMGAIIPSGMRAFTIHTPNVASHVAGFILPGSKVDILLTVKSHNDDSGGTTTTTLLQNLEILAVDQRLEAPSSSKVDIKDLRSVTLLVSPLQAAKLDMGQNAGTLHLSLRNPTDAADSRTQPVTLSELRLAKIPPPADKKQEIKEPARIRTLRGVNQGELELR